MEGGEEEDVSPILEGKLVLANSSWNNFPGFIVCNLRPSSNEPKTEVQVRKKYSNTYLYSRRKED